MSTQPVFAFWKTRIDVYVRTSVISSLNVTFWMCNFVLCWTRWSIGNKNATLMPLNFILWSMKGTDIFTDINSERSTRRRDLLIVSGGFSSNEVRMERLIFTALYPFFVVWSCRQYGFANKLMWLGASLVMRLDVWSTFVVGFLNSINVESCPLFYYQQQL